MSQSGYRKLVLDIIFKITIKGLNFNNSPAETISVKGTKNYLVTNVRITNCKFIQSGTEKVGYGIVDFAQFSSASRLDHNEFSASVGKSVRLGGGSNEIQVDHNIFLRTIGEAEIVCVKTSGNKIVYNLFLDSPESHLSLRTGKNNTAYGNVFRGTWRAIRVSGYNHDIRNNLILNPLQEGISIPAGCDEPYTGSATPPTDTSRWFPRFRAAQNLNVNHNTILFPKPRSGEMGSAISSIIPYKSNRCDIVPINNKIEDNLLVLEKSAVFRASYSQSERIIIV